MEEALEEYEAAPPALSKAQIFGVGGVLVDGGGGRGK